VRSQQRLRRSAMIVPLLLAGAEPMGCGASHIQVWPEHLYQRSPVDAAHYETVGNLDVTRSSFLLLGFPVSLPNLVAAIESGIQEANADAVTNLETETQFRSFFLFVGYVSHSARGDLIRFEERD